MKQVRTVLICLAKMRIPLFLKVHPHLSDLTGARKRVREKIKEFNK